MHEKWVTHGTLAVGVIAFLLPVVMFVYFMRLRGGNVLSKAFAWMLLAEAIGVAVTLAFAFLAHHHILKQLTIVHQSTMRMLLLNAAIVSSIHMAKAVLLLAFSDCRTKHDQET
jgi:hypothetical protein